MTIQDFLWLQESFSPLSFGSLTAPIRAELGGFDRSEGTPTLLAALRDTLSEGLELVADVHFACFRSLSFAQLAHK